MKLGQLTVVLLLLFSWFAARADGAPAVDVYGLVTKSCEMYGGEPITAYIDPQSGTIMNPLMATPLGSSTYWSSFKKGFVDMNYTAVDSTIKKINDSPDLDRALDRCYGKNQQAKVNFLFFMNQLQFQAKADAFVVTIGTFMIFEGAVVRIAARIPFLASVARGGAVMKVIASLVIANASYITLKALTRLIQLKRHTLHDKEVAEMKKANSAEKAAAQKALKSQEDSLDALQAFTIRDLESNIRTLQAKIPSVQDPARRAQLQDLVRKSEQTLNELKAS